jgi:orotidine-5'-phosphate decarboxylase
MERPRERIALAADVPLDEARALYDRLVPYVGWVKVGLSLFVEHGPHAVSAFVEAGARVFLDLKLHDIPNTVELAAAKASALGAQLLTVHASGGRAMLQAAVRGAAAGGSCRVLAVTALTSLGEADVAEIGWSGSPGQVAEHLAALAVEAGVSGLVCSAREVAAIRSRFPALFLCTPGIRPQGASAQDQARTETPGAAVQAGSDLLVVGRPIYTAADPVGAARAICEEIAPAS